MVTDPTEQFRSGLNALAQDHLVDDIIPETAQFIFLLESPHVQELKFAAPVSGSSGSSMSRHLFGDEYAKLPLGIIVKKNRDEELHRPSIDKVGLMNACNVPMQASAYRDTALVREQSDLLRILGSLRTAPATDNFRDPAWGQVQELLLCNFRRRLHALRERALYIVPCGRCAQKFFALADVGSPNWTVMDGVPHPSYNNWSKPTYAAAVERLVLAFRASHNSPH